MAKVAKIIFILTSISIGLIGIYLFFLFKNIHFTITNQTSMPLSAFITIHSYDSSSDYTYPLLAKEFIKPNESKETFYTVDESYNGTECIKIFFKNEKAEEVVSFPCPQEDETLIVK